MVAAAAEGLERWERVATAHRPLDMLPSFSALAMRVIARALFGQGLAQADIDRVSRVMVFVLDYQKKKP